MSWSALKKTFSPLAADDGRRRRLYLPKRRSLSLKLTQQNDNKRLHCAENIASNHQLSAPNLKRSKLDVDRKSKHIPANSDSDESINYDPDYDDYCGATQSVRASPLVTYQTKSHHTSGTQCSSTTNHMITPSRPSRNQTTTPWKPLTRSFREIQDDINCLEQSIIEPDSSDSENEHSQKQSTDSHYEITLIPSSSEHDNAITTISQAESSPTPSPLFERDNTNPELDLLVEAIQKDFPPPRKKSYCRKDGYAAKLATAVNRFESDYAFWQHEKRTGLLPIGLQAEVRKIQNTFGRSFITFKPADTRMKEFSVCVTENSKIAKMLLIGTKVEIELSSNFYCIDGKKTYLACNKMIKL